jgi:hypothetical protein
MIHDEIIDWLLKGDISIKYQTYLDLLNENKTNLQNRISKEGWGLKFLFLQNKNGHWGKAFYNPKWTSTHYTLLDLRNLNISPKVPQIVNTVQNVLNLDFNKKSDAGSNTVKADICLNGMVLNYASYFNADANDLIPIVDYLINNQMSDGGFNCMSTRKGAVHSSLHTTLSALEGFFEFRKNGHKYRNKDIRIIEKQSIEFILQHRLFKSDKTGKVINEGFTRLPYPSRWRYDILRCLDYFQYAGVKYDKRMDDAIELILSKRKKNGLWNVQSKYPGFVHFEMEKAGKPSRWNTLRALRVLKYFGVS